MVASGPGRVPFVFSRMEAELGPIWVQMPRLETIIGIISLQRELNVLRHLELELSVTALRQTRLR